MPICVRSAVYLSSNLPNCLQEYSCQIQLPRPALKQGNEIRQTVWRLLVCIRCNLQPKFYVKFEAIFFVNFTLNVNTAYNYCLPYHAVNVSEIYEKKEAFVAELKRTYLQPKRILSSFLPLKCTAKNLILALKRCHFSLAIYDESLERIDDLHTLETHPTVRLYTEVLALWCHQFVVDQ